MNEMEVIRFKEICEERRQLILAVRAFRQIIKDKAGLKYNAKNYSAATRYAYDLLDKIYGTYPSFSDAWWPEFKWDDLPNIDEDE